jgi:alkylhydroperoxidase family enzyme
MARIDPVEPERIEPSLARLLAEREAGGVVNRNAMLTMARVPEIVAPLYALFDRLTRDVERKSSIPMRLRHLIMLRVVRVNECRY